MTREDLLTFGPFSLDPAQRVLLHNDAPLRLTPREIDVLVTLVAHQGELVEKGRFFDEVWRGVCVEECNLSQHVAGLRRVLGDDAHKPTYIETVPRRGYRFIAPVARAPRPIRAPPPAPPAPGVDAAASPPPRLEAAPGAPATEPVAARVPPRAPRGKAVARASAAFLGVVALGVAGGWRTLRAGASARDVPVRSIAVLPVANLTGDAHHDHLAEVLTDGLLREVARASGLEAKLVLHPEADALAAPGAEALLETALLSVDGRVRLAAEILEARTRRLIWADVLETNELSVFDADRTIVAAIASHLPEAAGAQEGTGADARATAQRECALARRYLERRSPQVVPEALEHFAYAAKLDPRYAPAWVGLADANLLGLEQRVLAPRTALRDAEGAARRALELDPRLAGAHAVLGAVAAARWDFEGAETSYRRALDLDPSLPIIHERYAALLTVLDRHEESIAAARVGRDLSPGCAAAATALAAAYYHAGETDAAIEQALATLRLTPRFAGAYDVLGWAHLAKGRTAEAAADFGEAIRLSGGSPAYVAALARVTARTGATEDARRLLADLQRRAHERATSPLELAAVYEALGETAQALRQVERAAATGAPWLQRVDEGLSLTSLHDHARFRALVSQMRRAIAPGNGRRAGSALPASPREPVAQR